MNTKPIVDALRTLLPVGPVPATRIVQEILRQGGPPMAPIRVEQWLLQHVRPSSEVALLKGRPPVKLFLPETALRHCG